MDQFEEESLDTLSSVYLVVGLFPVWSIVSHLLTGFILIGTQNVLKRTLPRYFDILNEFICCFTWVCWGLETVLLSYMRSSVVGMIFLFGRLMLYPFISYGAPNNPCVALYLYLTGEDKKRRHIDRFFVSILIELVAVVVALLFCNYYWTLLGVTVSKDHFVFLEVELSYFLKTSPHYGFLNEFFLSFLMFQPSIFLPSSLFQSVLDSLFTIFLILQFNTFTGAFMNPMSALTCTLFWHSLTTWEYLVHILVFWIGPFIGTMVASWIHLYIQGGKQKQM